MAYWMTVKPISQDERGLHWLQLFWEGRGYCCPMCSRWASSWTVKHRVISVASLDTVKRREPGVDGVRRRKDFCQL